MLLETVRAHSPVSETSRDPRVRGWRILIADDDNIQLKLLKAQLEQRGFSVETAGDGEDALEKAERLRPDAIISDVLMPKMDGFRLCQAVRKSTRLASTPFLLISSVFVETSDRVLAETVGCDGFYSRKPDAD